MFRTFWPILLLWGICANTQFYDPYPVRPQYPQEPFDYPIRPPQPQEPSTVFQYNVGATSTSPRFDTIFYGGVIDVEMTLEANKSPYVVKEDVIVGPNGVLIVEPGVVVKFAPMTGITVRGVLKIKGLPNQRVVLTNTDSNSETPERSLIRLVDGPTVYTGRLQIFHKEKWRSVCTNSKNWTIHDIETACRQLGFQGGSWWSWMDREPGPVKPRLLYEEPRCVGTEQSLFSCHWESRQMGAGVCDYHADLGITCQPSHANPSLFSHWRGIRFENALFEKRLQQDNTLFVPVSLSSLHFTDVQYAGSGRDYNASSAIHVHGVPPEMHSINVDNSAYNGLNITAPMGPVLITNSTIRANRGYGVFINSSYGDVLIKQSQILDNGADGIRYVRVDPRLDDKFDRSDIFDFCMFPTTMSQTYPISVIMEQGVYNPTDKECSKVFMTKYNQLITIEVVSVQTDRNDSAIIEIFDGSSESDRNLAKFSVRNHTKLQAVTTTRNALLVKFIAQPKTQISAFVRLTAGPLKKYDLNITGSSVVNNNGRGIFVEGLRSSIHIHRTSISSNNHVAGIHVMTGSGDINVTDSRIAFNQGDGLNISYTGGSTNITRSIISSNAGFGVATWINDTNDPQYILTHQEIDIAYSEIFKNQLTGILVGNFCRDSIVNITGNWFNDSSDTALEIKSCWKKTPFVTNLQIGHNVFTRNQKDGIKITPALNIYGRIEYNHITEHFYGGVFIKNPPKYEEEFEFDVLPAYLLIQFNEMQYNKGVYVVNIGVSPYSDVQKILFTRNFIRYNKINEPFDQGSNFLEEGKVRLVPRSRVAAPVVVSSSNVDIFRNIIQNHESRYEIGSHLEDQSKTINCTYNWLGYSQEDKIYHRLFHRKDRYNLANFVYLPYLLHSSNPAATTVIINPTYVHQFWVPGSNTVGGEVDGIENLRAGEYFVERDINIRPGGKLTLQNGVTLRFPPSVGLMVAGRLEARGTGPNDILLTLKEERIEVPNSDGDITEPVPIEDPRPVRLLGGRTSLEGRLQVRINGTWGTVCDYGWTITNAALVCQQLGLVLNPSDWLLQRNEVPLAGTTEPILLSNVRCAEDDLDVTKCRAEQAGEFENTCTHSHDVGLRCHESVWAGVRFGVISEASTLQFVTVEKAGLLDYATHEFKPAIQIDLARHSLENVRVVNNAHDGLGIIYTDLYSAGASNTIRNSEFSSNGANGISFKQLGMNLISSFIDNNNVAGIRHNPTINKKSQRELAGWFSEKVDPYIYNPTYIPNTQNFALDRDESRYVITQKVTGITDIIDRVITVSVQPGYVVGIQLLNPIHTRSTEQIFIHDTVNFKFGSKFNVWDLKRDLTVFPVTSSSFGINIRYISGFNALGNVVLLLSSVRAPIQNIPNRVVSGAYPVLQATNTKIRDNRKGIWASYYNRYIDEFGDHYLRRSNESFRFLNCEISRNQEEAIFVHAPYWNVHSSNISEITFEINSTLITDNGRGIVQFNRDLRQSNNLFHWFLYDNSIERNSVGGFEITLPYVWQYNENFTHTLRFINNTFRLNQGFGFVIDGHFANLNITDNNFEENQCRFGLISFRGMEKQMRLYRNSISRNVGDYMIEFHTESQSEILGVISASFRYNSVKFNRQQNALLLTGPTLRSPTCVVCFHGTQQVNVNYNLFGENTMDYELIAGVRTAKLETSVDVSENWWGSNEISVIKERIFDFDDWNNHALAKFRPYLLEDSVDGSSSVSWETPSPVNLNDIGGRIKENLVLYAQERPYIIRRDITIMPEATLTITPNVVMEFEPNVGILVLGTLKAQGKKGYEIIMRPTRAPQKASPPYPALRVQSIRLCTGRNCTEGSSLYSNHGFLEYYNRTTMQWVPVCDDRFTERNAQVVCRELGHDVLNVRFDLGPRVEFHPNSLSRIWSYLEPLQCTGGEPRLEECAIRLNGQQYNHVHKCMWNSNFVYVHCGQRNLYSTKFWGGIRFAHAHFEQSPFENARRHDAVTHQTGRRSDSILEYVNITGAGILHNEKSPAVLAVTTTPSIISNLNVSHCADDGVMLVSPKDQVQLLFNNIENNLGVGISIASLTGEGRESEESSFTPLKHVSLPYNVFSLVEMCDTAKEIVIEERILIYYKYDNIPVNCVKIFRSAYGVKPFGFRLLQFNLFNTSGQPGWPDSILLYDGSIYNVSAPLLTTLSAGSANAKKLIRTTSHTLSVRLFAKGASANYGFIAEIVTLPVSAIAFDRDVRHNISYSIIRGNERGAVNYHSAGEVNPTLTVQWNQFTKNCEHLYGNFTTCNAAVLLDVQNTQNFYFRNNLLRDNQGGLQIKSDSRGSATALKGWIFNNLWVANKNKPVLSVEGRPGSAYQQVTIYRNYFTRNYAPYEDTLVLKQVISNFTYNFVQGNRGFHILEVSGFEKVRLQYYQTTSHNGFYQNFAFDRDNRGTIIAGTAGQHYVDNVLFNPDNDYEIVTVNRSSTLEVWKTPIDAKHNWWGYNETLAVSGRVKDRSDTPDLLEVDFRPFLMNNRSILSGKCPPGWTQVGDTCYIYIGAPMTYQDAKLFCQEDNATMPYISGNYIELYYFLRSQQEHYMYYDRVWVQHIDRINQCTVFTYQRVDIDHCLKLNPFICEIDPKVRISFLNWRDDTITVAMMGVIIALVIILALILIFWFTKSRKRNKQRLERRNSIRQSLRSLKSIGSTNGLSEVGYRRNLNVNGSKGHHGSLDSMDKSQYNSSLDDTQSYDIYETHNPSLQPSFDHLAYQNRGFKDTSTFASREDTAESYYESETLPMSSTADSILDMKRNLESSSSFRPSDYYVHTPPPSSDSPEPYFFHNNPPSMQTYLDYNNSVVELSPVPEDSAANNLLPKSKSEAFLETNFDEDSRPERTEGIALTLASRSKSQPLETSM